MTLALNEQWKNNKKNKKKKGALFGLDLVGLR